MKMLSWLATTALVSFVSCRPAWCWPKARGIPARRRSQQGRSGSPCGNCDSAGCRANYDDDHRASKEPQEKEGIQDDAATGDR
jgi:hypothetical protein